MDWRWQPTNRDSKRDVQVILHPTAAIPQVRRGVDTGSDDSIDLSEFVKDVSHSAFEANVTCVFNRELFGTSQPKPNQVLEIQLWQKGWKTLWIGIIDSISSFTLSRGERQMQMVAKTREQFDIWKTTKRVTPLFPQLTNLLYIVQKVARTCDMQGDEIALPPTAIMTAHSNTQLADMTAWDMVNSVFVALGWTPFIDGQGRLRAADRTLQGRIADIVLSDDRIIKVGGQRMRPPASRVRVSWLNPALVMWKQQNRLLTSRPVTVGWYLMYHDEEIFFSEDKTQRATGTKFKANPSIEKWAKARWARVTWIQQTPVGGKLHFDNKVNFELYVSLASTWVGLVAGQTFFGFDSVAASIAQAAFLALLLKMGPGVYEIWGTPYDYVHAKNVSEAFDSSVPEWVDNPIDISCDYIVNEEHGKAVAIRELIYSAWSASKWTVTIVDDPRVEYGDLLQFPDGSLLFVEDFTRTLSRGSEATLEIKGFLVKPVASQVGQIGSGDGGSGGGGDGGGGGGGGDTSPPEGGGGGGPSSGPGSQGEPIVPMSADPAAFEDQCKRSLAFYNRTDYSYWHGLCHPPEPWQAGDGKYYQGWDAYMEQRAAPGDTGSGDHALLPLPAIHQNPIPVGYPSGGWT